MHGSELDIPSSAPAEEGGAALPSCYKSDCASSFLARLPLDEDALIVPKAATAGGFRTVRVGKRNSARNALAADRAAAFWGIGLRGIGSSRAVAAIGLCIRRLHPNGHSQNAHACDGQSALHYCFLLGEGNSR